MNERQQTQDNQPKVMARSVRMKPKVVFWIVMGALGMALMSFSVMFIEAGYRNGWW